MKSKLLSLLLFFFLFSIELFSQGVDNLWVMGYSSWAGRPYGGIDLNFTSNSMDTSYHSRKMNIDDANGVICDKYGNLLFYSNGVWIANAANDTMLNGSGLNPSQYTTSVANDHDGLYIPQANLIIPFPGDSTKYYLFHNTIDDYPNFTAWYLYYSVIDMTADNGRGAVIQKNTVLRNDNLMAGRLTACKHANGRDWWLIAHQHYSNRYYKYLITPSGISDSLIQDIGTVRISGYNGQTVFSPDGKIFADFDEKTGLDLFDFDRCTGALNFKMHADTDYSASPGGAAFSPNSKILYVASDVKIFQYDMSAANIAASKTIVAVWDTFYSPSPPFATVFFLAQLAPDGKIYINCGNGTLDIHVINNPDSIGLGCDVCQHCVHLPAFNAFTIANHPNYFLGWENGSVCDSLPHVGIIELVEDNKINVYPNPINHDNEEITFTYPSTGDEKTISVFNVDGKEVATNKLPQWSSVQHLKLPRLTPGIYLARLKGSQQSGNVKFVVK